MKSAITTAGMAALFVLFTGIAGARPVNPAEGFIFEVGGGGGNTDMKFSKDPFIHQSSPSATDFSYQNLGTGDLLWSNFKQGSSDFSLGFGYNWPRFAFEFFLGAKNVSIAWEESTGGTKTKDMKATGSSGLFGGRVEGTLFRGRRMSLDLAGFLSGGVANNAKVEETLVSTGKTQAIFSDVPGAETTAAIVSADGGLEFTASWDYGKWVPWFSLGARSQTTHLGLQEKYRFLIWDFVWDLRDFDLAPKASTNAVLGVDWRYNDKGSIRLAADLKNPSGLWLTWTHCTGPRGGKKEEEPVPAQTAVVPATAARMNIAVADLDAQNVSAGDAAVVADMLRGEMVKTGRFVVVERKSMDKVMMEQGIQQTGCTDQACAIKLGKMLNVQRIVVGSFGKLMGSTFLNIRVVDVEVGQVVYSDSAKGDNVDEVTRGAREIAIKMARDLK